MGDDGFLDGGANSLTQPIDPDWLAKHWQKQAGDLMCQVEGRINYLVERNFTHVTALCTWLHGWRRKTPSLTWVCLYDYSLILERRARGLAPVPPPPSKLFSGPEARTLKVLRKARDLAVVEHQIPGEIIVALRKRHGLC